MRLKWCGIDEIKHGKIILVCVYTNLIWVRGESNTILTFKIQPITIVWR